MSESTPSREDVKEAMRNGGTFTDTEEAIERKLGELHQNETWAMLIAKERQEIIQMRSRWSNWILFVIVAISFFDMVLIIGIGRMWFVFNNSYSVPLFIGESLIKLLGLAFLIVHFLFNNNSMGKNKNGD